MIFIKFTKLCDCPRNSVLGHSPHPGKIPYTCLVGSYSHPQPRKLTDSLFLWSRLLWTFFISGIIYGLCVRLLSLSVMDLRCTHVVALPRPHWFSLLESVPLCGRDTLFICPQ